MEGIKKYLAEFNNILKETDDIYKGLAKKFALPDCAFWILYQLRSRGRPLTQSEICSDFYVPKQTVSSAIQKLFYDGYISFSEGADRRSKPISLTVKGTEFAVKTVDKVIAAETEAIAEMTESERDALIIVSRRYADLLKANIDHYPQLKSSR